MCNPDPSRFFRPWNCGRGDEEESKQDENRSTTLTYENVQSSRITSNSRDSIKIETDEESSCENAASSSNSTRSCSVCSADTEASSLNVLENFVLNSQPTDKITPRGFENGNVCLTSPAAAYEWNMYNAPTHQNPNYQCNWSLTNPYFNAGPILNYALLPNQLQIQEAINRISQQEAAAKRIKKLRPKKFACDQCSMAFSNKGQLKGHFRIHTGERPFKCETEGCGKSFTRNEELTRHKRIHTGLRPYRCTICNKGFGRKDHLKKHTKTHENRNLYHLAAVTVGSPFAPYAHPPSMPPTGIPIMYPIPPPLDNQTLVI